jgi:hypothetical protein
MDYNTSELVIEYLDNIDRLKIFNLNLNLFNRDLCYDILLKEKKDSMMREKRRYMMSKNTCRIDKSIYEQHFEGKWLYWMKYCCVCNTICNDSGCMMNSCHNGYYCEQCGDNDFFNIDSNLCSDCLESEAYKTTGESGDDNTYCAAQECIKILIKLDIDYKNKNANYFKKN